MIRLHTARPNGWTRATAAGARPRAAERQPNTSAEATLREWCETRAHPPSRALDGECFCGLVRYDE